MIDIVGGIIVAILLLLFETIIGGIIGAGLAIVGLTDAIAIIVGWGILGAIGGAIGALIAGK
ncbi:MAG: hypothetical protein ACPK7O_10235 [Methanobacterium sp.]